MNTAPTAHHDRFIVDRLPPPALRPKKIRTLPDLDLPPRFNAAQWLLMQGGRRAGDGPAVIAPGGRWSHSELATLVARMARRLVTDFGVVSGNRILLTGANSPELLVAILAALAAGAIAVPVLPLLRARELVPIIATARPQLALVDESLSAGLAKACQIAGQSVVMGDLVALAGPACGGAVGAKLPDSAPTLRDDPALILFSSGTTGRPKAAVHSHGDIASIVLTFGHHIFRARPGDVVLGTPSLAFAYGLGGLFAFPLGAGAAVWLDRAMRPAELLDAARASGATMLVTAPTAYRRLIAEDMARPLPRLRRCFSAGEPLPAATAQAWTACTGAPIVDLLGSTEMLGPYVSMAEENWRPGTIGRAVPGYELRLVDAEGRPVAAGAHGRLAVRGPTGCTLLDHGEQARMVKDGWTLTGDICRLDGDGYVSYEGRLDGIIVSAGYNISAVEVEEALAAHPAVAECAVIGVPDSDRGAVVAALIVTRKDVHADDALADALRSHVKAAIAPYKAPRRIRFVDALPKTATGKIRRRDLAALVDEDIE